MWVTPRCIAGCAAPRLDFTVTVDVQSDLAVTLDVQRVSHTALDVQRIGHTLLYR